MQVLVTGGAGYVGSHVAKQLYENGMEVIILDNLIHGHREFAKWGVFYEGDIGDEKLLNRIFSKHDVSAVMHFAAHALVGESVKNPVKYYENNVCKTLILLKAMLSHEVKNMVFSSSCAVYGYPEAIPIPESHMRNPINAYGKSKLAVENMLEDFNRAYGLNYVSLRYFNAAGADFDAALGEDHNPETHLIPLALDAALGRRETVEIFGMDYDTHDGTCLRDYIHVSDLALAHILALNHLYQNEESGAFNLGSGRGFSVREIIETVKRVTGREVNAVPAPRREGDPPVLVADSTRAGDVLKWKPQYGLEEIVKSAWRWHIKRFGVLVQNE
jgi:UDP-glucose 4-epimerase